MFRIKPKKHEGGIVIAVDGRAPAGEAPPARDPAAERLQRISIPEGDGRDSIFQTVPKREFLAWLPKKVIMAFLESLNYQLFILILVLYSLFASNLAVIAHAPPSADPWVDAFLILCMAVFSIEIVLTIACSPRPPWGMLFLDLIATASIAVDLSWVSEAANFDEANGSRTSQAAVISARAGRIVRLVRLLRLLRTVSLLSRLAKRTMQQRKAADSGVAMTAAGGAPSNIGGKLTDALVTQVALVIVLSVIIVALIISWGVQPSPFDAYVDALGASAGAPRSELQPQVDALLAFAKDSLPDQKPLTLRVGVEEWNWVEENGGWPAQPSAAAKFASADGDYPPAELVVNVEAQDAQDALLDVILILTVLLLLLTFVFTVNVTIYRTLVRPLERIYNIIRNNAGQVVAALGPGEEAAGGGCGGPGGPGGGPGGPDGEEDGDIGTIEAAVVKMSRIIQHASTQGRQGTHVARTLAVDADSKTKEWLATMVGGDALDEQQGAGGESSGKPADGSAHAAEPQSPQSPQQGALKPAGSRGVRFSVGGKLSAAASAAAAAMLPSPAASRLSGMSGGSASTPPASRPTTGSFGALTAGANSLEAAACLAAYGGDLTPAQREALLGVDLEALHSFKFDILALPRDSLTPHVVTMFLQLGLARFGGDPLAGGTAAGGFVDVALLWRFVDEVSTFYHEVPYHNLWHCVDVTHSTFLLLDRLRVPAALSPVECFALMVAALAHDMDHPGVNNAFLVNARDALALAYNDASVLENRHVACLYALVTQRPDVNVFKDLEPAAWREVRRLVIAAVLHTDMTQHFPMVSKLEVFLELKAADIQAAHAAQRAALQGKTGGGGASPVPASALGMLSAAAAAYAGAGALPSIFSTAEERTLLICAILHCADISNPARPPGIAERWTGRVLDEFFAQGDRERAAGHAVSPMCDRATTSRAISQVNFIEFVVVPLFALVARIFPDAGELMENAAATRRFWQSELQVELAGEAAKGEEEKKAEAAKAEGRMGAFMEKYREALAVAQRRRRDLRRRLNSLPPSVAAVALPAGGGFGAVPSHSLSSPGSFAPLVPSSARSSSSSTHISSRVGSGSLIAGLSPAASGSPTAAAAAQLPASRGASFVKRTSQSGSDMASAVVSALLHRRRSASGQGAALGVPPPNAPPEAPPQSGADLV